MKILLGVTGGIAAYKSLELCRLFIKAGHEVQVVMTEGAKQFIAPLSFQALSGKPVRDSLFDANQEAGMGHIELARWADWIVVAPASANSLSRFAHGMADDLLSTLLLATDRPVILAPAMNRLMWKHKASQANIAKLKEYGYFVLSPASGEQACGEVGEGRLPEPETIFDTWQLMAQQHLSQYLPAGEFWQGRELLITAGPTFEDIDPVRFIGNRSSGKMGFAIAEQAAFLGAKVTLIAGPVNLKTPAGVNRVDVRSAMEMFAQVKNHYAQAQVFVSAAAVADFRSAVSAEHKIKKTSNSDELNLSLTQNPDIVAWVANQEDKPFVVGFAAETQNVLEYARDKLQRKNLDMICANQVGRKLGFDQSENALTLMTSEREVALGSSSKQDQARQLLEFIAEA